ncbi:hypothetical protein PHYPSEUDO_005497 [Phytophthora pseudosyringae]|uniref:Uncharacterized protein n=1 Tax=Phytophthora pseudosyringae TaxID=221518 RepID=A0A8T1VL82_9STRA|nr:hypothetical protein PHYPSEUDO_005497 [Phytophthora pseudosyringae]
MGPGYVLQMDSDVAETELWSHFEAASNARQTLPARMASAMLGGLVGNEPLSPVGLQCSLAACGARPRGFGADEWTGWRCAPQLGELLSRGCGGVAALKSWLAKPTRMSMQPQVDKGMPTVLLLARAARWRRWESSKQIKGFDSLRRLAARNQRGGWKSHGTIIGTILRFSLLRQISLGRACVSSEKLIAETKRASRSERRHRMASSCIELRGGAGVAASVLPPTTLLLGERRV